MNHGMVSALVLILLITCSGIVRGQSLGGDGPRHANPSEASGMTRAPESSWEGWLHHGARDVTPEAHVPSGSPDLGIPSGPSSPSMARGSGLLGPEAGSRRSRLRSKTETEGSGGGTGSAGMHRDF